MKKTGAEILLACLKAEGVEVVFGHPGGAIMPVYDALYDSDILHILTRHEQGAAHAADGYARATGKVGVCFATSGPGATNLITGLANALMDSVPLVAITGQVPTAMIGTDAFQEADVYGISIPVTKYNYLVKDLKKLPRVVAEAFHIARSGRPGPVLIDLPKDLQNQVMEYEKAPPVFLEKYRLPDVEKEQGEPLERAVKALLKAQKPVLYVGGGTIISGASELVYALAEKASIPVTTTLMATGAFPGTHELSLGMLGMHGTRAANYAMDQADLIIACGARFDDRVTGKVSEFAKNATIIHIEIDPAEISKIVRAHIPIKGDVKQVLAAILKRLEGVKIPKHKKWLDQIQQWKRTYPLTYGSSDKAIKPQFVIEELYRLTEGKAIITTDVGQHQMWAAQFYKFHNPRSFITSGGLGTMGYGFPAAIGAQVAFPDRSVFTIAGDGSFLMNIQELATVFEYQIPVKVAIINNGYLGMVRQWQEIFFNRRYSQVDLKKGNPDFVMVANGFGVEGIRVTKAKEVRPALEKALAIKGPVVLDIHVDQEENVFPMVPSGGTVKDIIG